MQTKPILSFKIDQQLDQSHSTNKIYAGMHWTQRKEMKDFWHELVYYALLQAKIERKLFKDPVDIVMYSNDKLDADNHLFILKMIIDTMCDYPILVDDTREYVNSVKFEFYDGEGILVEVYERNDDD